MDTKLRFLLIEDSEPDAALITRGLTKAGIEHALERVETEPELLRALSGRLPDLIISDFTLPRFDGLRALDIAVARAPHTPFLFVSGTLGDERAIEALKRGATDYVLKSNLARLSSAVERALRESGLKAAQRQLEQQRREQEMRLERLTRAYRMLSSSGSALLRSPDRRLLLEELCRIAVLEGGYDRAVISLRDPDGKRLRPHAWAGRGAEPLRGLDDADLGDAAVRTPCGAVLRDGVEYVHNDLDTLTALAAHPIERELLRAGGYRTFAAFPIRADGTPTGVLSLASRRGPIRDEAELEVLRELSANLGFALHHIEKYRAVQAAAPAPEAKTSAGS